MIRLAVLLMLAALPASAQDFRGLRPGMHASALGPIGEPMEIVRDSDTTLATFPLPFGQRLEVLYDADGTLMRVTSFAYADAPDAPDLGGLQVGEMTFRTVQRRLRRAASEPDLPPLLLEHRDGTGVSLVYRLPEAPETLVVLRFDNAEDAARNGDDAVLVAASLMLRDAIDVESYATDIPDDTLPSDFPIPLDEAFPSLIP